MFELLNNALKCFLLIGLFLIIVYTYFLPSIVACKNKHRYDDGIIILNIFLGWTFIFWVIALVWALSNPNEEY